MLQTGDPAFCYRKTGSPPCWHILVISKMLWKVPTVGTSSTWPNIPLNVTFITITTNRLECILPAQRSKLRIILVIKMVVAVVCSTRVPLWLQGNKKVGVSSKAFAGCLSRHWVVVNNLGEYFSCPLLLFDFSNHLDLTAYFAYNNRKHRQLRDGARNISEPLAPTAGVFFLLKEFHSLWHFQNYSAADLYGVGTDLLNLHRWQ